jgi:DNA-binding transcriptional ArsR family regulator
LVAKVSVREQKTRKRILDTLAKNEDGLTISEFARILGMHYTTVSKYLAVMEAENKVVHRDVGMAKMFKMKVDV